MAKRKGRKPRRLTQHKHCFYCGTRLQPGGITEPGQWSETWVCPECGGWVNINWGDAMGQGPTTYYWHRPEQQSKGKEPKKLKCSKVRSKTPPNKRATVK